MDSMKIVYLGLRPTLPDLKHSVIELDAFSGWKGKIRRESILLNLWLKLNQIYYLYFILPTKCKHLQGILNWGLRAGKTVKTALSILPLKKNFHKWCGGGGVLPPPSRPKEDDRCPGAGVIGCCESPSVGAGRQSQVFCRVLLTTETSTYPHSQC